MTGRVYPIDIQADAIEIKSKSRTLKATWSFSGGEHLHFGGNPLVVPKAENSYDDIPLRSEEEAQADAQHENDWS